MTEELTYRINSLNSLRQIDNTLSIIFGFVAIGVLQLVGANIPLLVVISILTIMWIVVYFFINKQSEKELNELEVEQRIKKLEDAVSKKKR